MKYENCYKPLGLHPCLETRGFIYIVKQKNMRKRLDKVFCLPTAKNKVYVAKGKKKKKKSFWQEIYQLLF